MASVLLAIDPSSVALLRKSMRIGLSVARDFAKLHGFLSAEDAAREETRPADDALLSAVNDTFPNLRIDFEQETGADLMQRVESEFRKGREGLDLLGEDEEFLGPWSWVRDRIREKRSAYLRQALKKLLSGNDEFDPGAGDAAFRKIDQRVGSDVDFIVTGHTHMSKALARERASGHYFNCGTWISLIRLKSEWLKDETSFKPVWTALKDGTWKALLDAKVGPKKEPLLIKRPSVVRITAAEGGAEGSLCDVAATGMGVELRPIGDPARTAKGAIP